MTPKRHYICCQTTFDIFFCRYYLFPSYFLLCFLLLWKVWFHCEAIKLGCEEQTASTHLCKSTPTYNGKSDHPINRINWRCCFPAKEIFTSKAIELHIVKNVWTSDKSWEPGTLSHSHTLSLFHSLIHSLSSPNFFVKVISRSNKTPFLPSRASVSCLGVHLCWICKNDDIFCLLTSKSSSLVPLANPSLHLAQLVCVNSVDLAYIYHQVFTNFMCKIFWKKGGPLSMYTFILVMLGHAIALWCCASFEDIYKLQIKTFMDYQIFWGFAQRCKKP